MLTQDARLRIPHSFPAVVRAHADVASLYLNSLYKDPEWSVSPDDIGPITLNGEQLSIPFRVYLLDPSQNFVSTANQIYPHIEPVSPL